MGKKKYFNEYIFYYPNSSIVKKCWKNIAIFSNLETINDFTQNKQEKLSFTTAQLCSLRYIWSSIPLKSQPGGNK